MLCPIKVKETGERCADANGEQCGVENVGDKLFHGVSFQKIYDLQFSGTQFQTGDHAPVSSRCANGET
jgi:hypothetical protein